MKFQNSLVARAYWSRVSPFVALFPVLYLGACAGAPAKDGTGGHPYQPDGGFVQVDGGYVLKDSSWEYIPQTSSDARPPRCDENGQNCHCMNILSLGKVAHYGGNTDSTDAFQKWMNEKSSAQVTMMTNRTTLTKELLSNYDVLILQALEDNEYTGFWTFTQAEVDAVAEWVQEGNGVISMTGYGGQADEVNGTNQLLAFAGLSYTKGVDTFTGCASDDKCYCHDNSMQFKNWTTGSWIAQNMLNKTGGVAAVGVFHGRPITCDANVGGPCDVVAEDPTAGIVGVGKTVGTGRVFAWSDEWVTYTTQWGQSSQSHGTDCDNFLASDVFNCPQFWYNVIRWSLPDAGCFNIIDPQVIP